MADDEKNEETPEETAPAEEAAPAEAEAAPAEPEAAEPEAAEAEPAAADVESEEDRPAGDVNPPPPALSKAQQRAAAKQAAASERPVRTPEERQAERAAERKRKAEQRRRRRVKEREKAKTSRSAPAEPVAAVHAETTGQPKTRTGRVVSDKAEQTITVRIEIARRHRRYEKIVRSSSTLHAHDPANDAHEGDLVRVVESRPLSKTKRWRLVEVLERAR
jgi:small subunit ribosomal protein S17